MDAADDRPVPLFASSAQQQEGSGRAECYDVTVASPELPCGAAWLASALLELGVPLWRPWGIADDDAWQDLGHARWRYRYPGSGWSRLVTGLVDGRVYRLRERPVPRFTHAWPGQLPATARTILVVRDPRDALYSAWRRQRRSGDPHAAASFAHYARSPHPQLPLTRAQYARAWWHAWRAHLHRQPHLVLRFESIKHDPRAALREALAFLDLRVSGRAAARARRAASHDSARQAEEKLIARGVVPGALLAGGIPFEWRRHFRTEDHAALGEGWNEWLSDFGYDPPPADARGAPVTAIDRDALQDALLRGLHVPPPQHDTLRQALRAPLETHRSAATSPATDSA